MLVLQLVPVLCLSVRTLSHACCRLAAFTALTQGEVEDQGQEQGPNLRDCVCQTVRDGLLQVVLHAPEYHTDVTSRINTGNMQPHAPS